MIEVTVDTTGFKRLVSDLAQMSGKSFDTVLRHEAARVIEKAIQFTPRAKPKKYKLTAEEEAKKEWASVGGTPQLDVARTGRVWWTETDDRYVDPRRPRTSPGRNGRHFHIMNDPSRRWNSKRWAAYRQMEAERQRLIQRDIIKIMEDREAAKKAAGLSKNSWYQIGQTLRLEMRGIPQYVIKAVPSTGKRYQNGMGTERTNGKEFLLFLENKYPALAIPKNEKMNGHKILQRAINTRLKAFEHEMRHGVFNDMKARAQRHPGVFVSP